MQIIRCLSTFVGVIRRRVICLSTLHGDMGRLDLSNKLLACSKICEDTTKSSDVRQFRMNSVFADR